MIGRKAAGAIEQILAKHGIIEETHVRVERVIDQICATQEVLRNVDISLLATWEGDGADAFTALSNENHATIKTTIEKTRALNRDLSLSNQTFEQNDQAISGNLGGK